MSIQTSNQQHKTIEDKHRTADLIYFLLALQGQRCSSGIDSIRYRVEDFWNGIELIIWCSWCPPRQHLSQRRRNYTVMVSLHWYDTAAEWTQLYIATGPATLLPSTVYHNLTHTLRNCQRS